MFRDRDVDLGKVISLHAKHCQLDTIERREYHRAFYKKIPVPKQEEPELTVSSNKGFRGVTGPVFNDKYSTRIEFKSKRIHIGLYNSPEEASLAYNQKYYDLRGKYPYQKIKYK